MAIATPHVRRPVLFAVAAVLVAAAAAGFVALRLSGGSSPVASSSTGYTEAIAGSWQRLNPLYANTNQVDADLSRLIFLGLVQVGPDGAVQPGLASLPAISNGGRTYTFQLRAGVRWQDGTPVTSADVAFTIQQLTAPDFKGDPNLAAGWIGVTVSTPDARTIVVTLKQPSAPFLARNATIGILPEHLLKGLSPDALYDAPFNTAPTGTGPYRLESINSTTARLVANASYVDGKPAIESLTLRFYPDYPTALAALQSGQADGLMVTGSLTASQVADLRSVKNTRALQLEGGDYAILYLNNDDALFSDPRVRQAISLAIDRNTLVQRVYFGIATPSSSPVAPHTWAYDGAYDVTRANLTQARQLLAEAGWEPDPSTHILVRNGAEFRFTIRTDNDPTRVALANEVARQLEPLGIRTVVASTPFSVLRRDFLQDRQYQAAIADWAQGPDPDPYSGWHSSQIGPAGLNLANFSNAIADALIEKARTTDQLSVRKSVYEQFQQVWEQQAPSVILAYPGYLYVVKSSLQGVTNGVMFEPSYRFAGIQNWHE